MCSNAFYEWFRMNLPTGKSEYQVGNEIFELPCNCVRQENEPAFKIEKKEGKGWVHTSCGRIIFSTSIFIPQAKGAA